MAADCSIGVIDTDSCCAGVSHSWPVRVDGVLFEGFFPADVETDADVGMETWSGPDSDKLPMIVYLISASGENTKRVLTFELNFMRKFVKFRGSRYTVWLAVMLGGVLPLSAGRIMLRASFCTAGGHRGAIATDLDSRSVTDGMQDNLCFMRPLSWQAALQKRTM